MTFQTHLKTNIKITSLYKIIGILCHILVNNNNNYYYIHTYMFLLIINNYLVSRLYW